MRKLLFFDIDGTLTDEATGIIPESTRQAVAKARENGHLCFLNSGRTYPIIENNFKEMVDGIVCGLGTYIEYQGRILLHNVLNKELCKEIMKLALECNVECYFEGYYGVSSLENTRFEMFDDLNKSFVEKKMPLSYYPKDDLLFEKFCVMEDDFGDYVRFNEFVGKYFRKIDRGNNFYEYEQLGYSKATGIDYLCNYFNTTLDNCYVFGDSTNDLPMLEHVKHSVLMENGNPMLRDKVEFVTTLSSVDGVENALKHYELI
ncbi:MAG: Cof-type HAD-IIB family hydrolase [Erysipelotrichales bacterium]|nr:Cof-type HAD-IIB family hydrolase [Erysipelotrichales bacterium]